MKKILAGRDKAEFAVKVLEVFIIGVYPLILFELDLGSVAIQSLLLFLGAMGALLYSILLIRLKAWELSMPRSRIDLVVLILAVYAFFKVIVKIITATETVHFDVEVTVLALAAIYLLIASRPVFSEKDFDILLFSGLIVFALLLIKYFCGDGADSILAIFLKDKTGIASYVMLVCMVGLWQYIRCRDKLRSFFYIGVLTVGFLILFINQNRVSIYLMAMVFIALPILQRPTAELIKKDMQIFFIYLFLLSNMSLLTNYTSLLRIDVSYDLEQSVYLELLVAIGGIFFFKYWDRIPEGVELRRLVMRKMRRGYQFLLKLMGIVFIGILLGGENWKKLPDEGGVNAVKGFAASFVDEVLQGESTFYLCFKQLGVIGSTLLLILCVLLIGRLRKNYRFDKPVTGMLILISGMFLIQLLFWNINSNTLAVYWMFIILAITYKEEKLKIISNKIKFQ